jgi:hypothetical protein
MYIKNEKKKNYKGTKAKKKKITNKYFRTHVWPRWSYGTIPVLMCQLLTRYDSKINGLYMSLIF